MTTSAGPRSWAGLTILLFAAVVAAGGCSSGPTDSSVPEPRGGGRAAGARPSSGNILADMGQPAMVLVVSGRLDGYLEPCGCAKGKTGGLIRRAEFIERLHEQHWPTVLIDLGSLIKEPVIGGGRDQSRIKFQFGLKALSLLKYDAMALNSRDLSIGVKHAMDLCRDELGATTKVVAANVTAAVPYQTNFRRSLVVKAGDVALGVTAVIDPESLKKLADPDTKTLLAAIQPPDEVLPNVLAELESESDYQVLSVEGPYDLARRLAEAYPGFDVVLSTSDGVGPGNRRPKAVNDDKTILMSTGAKGHYLGVIAFYRGQPEQRPSHQLVALDDTYDGRGNAMKTLIQDDYRAALKAAGVVEKYPKKQNTDALAGAVYVGAATCASCHANTYKKWTTTKHSQAFASLLHDPKPNTAFDAECVTCHTTGFKYASGWRSETATPYLAGNQCENCHGPGSKHAAEPDNAAFRQPMVRTNNLARTELCYQCHDHDNSVNFEVSKYWGQIVHKGLDEYKDPKVHVGVKARQDGRPSSVSKR